MNQVDFNAAYQDAVRSMERRLPAGAQQSRALLELVAKTVIIDKLVPPGHMEFIPGASSVDKQLRLQYARQDGSYTIHRHALNQLCSKVELPMVYTNKLLVGDWWRLDLLAHNLNELFHQPPWVDRSGGPTRFLHRIVDRELRGFLGRRFNRHLASAPLLRAFVETADREGAKPIEATNSPVRVALKCLLPAVFEAFPGEYICLGVEWTNSDFGAGRHSVRQLLWRCGSANATVLDEGISQVHIGSVIEDSDLEMSDETARKELEAQKSAISDTVTQQLSEKAVERLLRALRVARDEQIPWGKLRPQLSRLLAKSDIEWLEDVLRRKGESIIDLPPVSFAPDGTPTPNLYWAAGALSSVAARAEDPDRRLELQREAGKLLSSVLKQEGV